MQKVTCSCHCLQRGEEWEGTAKQRHEKEALDVPPSRSVDESYELIFNIIPCKTARLKPGLVPWLEVSVVTVWSHRAVNALPLAAWNTP